jgi:hypothetical protein
MANKGIISGFIISVINYKYDVISPLFITIIYFLNQYDGQYAILFGSVYILPLDIGYCNLLWFHLINFGHSSVKKVSLSPFQS